ncbi:ankyrin repeat domain-containing protein 34B [Ctenopharyngodon idella]|uniref:ankyrin repeat domain-containing protein 34B n=1 Tax=Ctenopharyngodon idella TaxID=7959 RepID=UPI002230FA48|nr:ankyrin repeat domain-containing protein 34B [Ctenopharyngodon idella]
MEGPQVVNVDSNSLLKAVYLCRLRLTRLLLEGGAYINESNECGETPLMVACRSRHTDQQSVSKVKMVGYLLESGADPNIQDKSGKTALMHACLEQAGSEVVALLLGSGADPCLEDHTGSSALIYAINASDEETLKMLMDACKARGKEVIIITPDKLAYGRQMTKQYLSIPPLAMVEQWDKENSTIVPCASPSDILLSTSPHGTLSSSPTEHMFSFQDLQSMTNSQPASPSHQAPLVHSRVSKLHNLQRLHSEPWLKIPQSFLAQQHTKTTPATEELPDITPEEEFSFRMKRLAFGNKPLSRHCSVDLKEANCLSQTLSQGSNSGGLRPEGALCRNMSFDSLSSLHSLSHPNLHSKSSVEALPADKDPGKSLPNLAVSSLRNIIQRRKLGMDHYSSDSQLSVSLANSPEDRKGHLEKRKFAANSRSPTLVGSRESLENASLTHLHRRNPISYERRGSGALLDPISHPKAGFLPPLNQHALIPNITGSGNSSSIGSSNKAVCGVAAGTKPCIPSAPAGFPKDLKTRRMLMRRHSMQTEQLKRLGEFTEIFGH